MGITLHRQFPRKNNFLKQVYQQVQKFNKYDWSFFIKELRSFWPKAYNEICQVVDVIFFGYFNKTDFFRWCYYNLI